MNPLYLSTRRSNTGTPLESYCLLQNGEVAVVVSRQSSSVIPTTNIMGLGTTTVLPDD